MSNREVVLVIQRYIIEVSSVKGINNSMELRSYSIWGAKELLNFICDHKYLSAIESIEYFIKLMDQYSCMNGKNSYMFSIAYDIAVNIYDQILSSHYVRYIKKGTDNHESKNYENVQKFTKRTC